MQNVDIMRRIVKQNMSLLLDGTLAHKLLQLQLGGNILDQDVIIHTHDNLIKRMYVFEIISRYHGVTVDDVENKSKLTISRSFECDSAKSISYKTNDLYCEIDMDPCNVLDFTTFRECLSSICSQASIMCKKHLIVLCRIDRTQSHVCLSRIIEAFHHTSSFLLTCDTCPTSRKGMCLIINLCVERPRLRMVTALFVNELQVIDNIDCEELMKFARNDLTNFALLCNLKSPLSFVGHLQSYIRSSIIEMVSLSGDSVKYCDCIRDFVIRIGASCTDPACVGRIVIEISESMGKNSCALAEVSAEMQANILTVNKPIFSLERYIHRVVDIFRN